MAIANALGYHNTDATYFFMQSITSTVQAPLVYVFLKEIKLRLMYSVLALIITFCVSYNYADDLLYWLIEPNKEIQSHFIFLNIPEALYTTLKITGFVTFCMCLPLLWYHTWSFFIPSCTRSERKRVFQVSMLFLFFLTTSIWWTLYKGMPLLTKFLLQFQIHQESFSIAYQATLNAYISWMISCLCITSIMAQLPTLLFIAVLWKAITPSTIARYRKGLFIMCILGAALVSPPDLMLQLTIACGFYAYTEFILWSLFIYTAFRENQQDMY